MKQKKTPIPPTSIIGIKSTYDKLIESDETKVSSRIYVRSLYLNDHYRVRSIANAVGICHNTVYSIIKRSDDDLKDRSTRPKYNPNAISPELEKDILELRDISNFGTIRISMELFLSRQIKIHHNTIYKILSKHKVTKRKRVKAANQELRDYYKSPFSFIEIDTKEITDLKALPKAVYDHVIKTNLPIYQFTAIDTYTRFRFLSYGYANTFTNAWAFVNYVLAQLDYIGVPRSQQITIQTDNGQEYGGWTQKKLDNLNRELMEIRPNTTLIHIPKLQKQKQGHVERSHRTDDDEFYIPHIGKSRNTGDMLRMSQIWINYYNNYRPHQGKRIYGLTPIKYIQKLKEDLILPESIQIDRLKNISVLLMDKVSIQITEMITRAKARVRSEKINFVQYVRGYYQ